MNYDNNNKDNATLCSLNAFHRSVECPKHRHAHMENQQLTKDEKGEHKWREKGWGKWRENESGSGRRSMRARANLSFFFSLFHYFLSLCSELSVILNQKIVVFFFKFINLLNISNVP